MKIRNEWYLGAAIGSLLVFAVSSGITVLALYAVLSITAASITIAAIATTVSLYAFYRCSWKFVESHGSGRWATG